MFPYLACHLFAAAVGNKKDSKFCFEAKCAKVDCTWRVSNFDSFAINQMLYLQEILHFSKLRITCKFDQGNSLAENLIL
jgi:hypothetical protein